MLPKDPIMLLSYINTQLRDRYRCLDQLCDDLQVDRGALTETLNAVNYQYDAARNQFV